MVIPGLHFFFEEREKSAFPAPNTFVQVSYLVIFLYDVEAAD